MNTSLSTGLTLVADLPQSVVCCFNALVEYLKPFHMLRMFYNIRCSFTEHNRVLCTTDQSMCSNFQPFQSDSDYLKMNSTTLENLEIFTNNVSLLCCTIGNKIESHHSNLRNYHIV